SANAINLNSNGSVVGSMRFDANVTLAATRTVTATNSTGSYINTNGNSGTISGVLAGSNPLTKMGNGRLSLTNAGNTFTGLLTVSGGDLNVRSPGILPTTTNAVTVATGAFISGDGTINRPVTLQSGSSI